MQFSSEICLIFTWSHRKNRWNHQLEMSKILLLKLKFAEVILATFKCNYFLGEGNDEITHFLMYNYVITIFICFFSFFCIRTFFFHYYYILSNFYKNHYFLPKHLTEFGLFARSHENEEAADPSAAGSEGLQTETTAVLTANPGSSIIQEANRRPDLHSTSAHRFLEACQAAGNQPQLREFRT